MLLEPWQALPFWVCSVNWSIPEAPASRFKLLRGYNLARGWNPASVLYVLFDAEDSLGFHSFTYISIHSPIHLSVYPPIIWASNVSSTVIGNKRCLDSFIWKWSSGNRKETPISFHCQVVWNHQGCMQLPQIWREWLLWAIIWDEDALPATMGHERVLMLLLGRGRNPQGPREPAHFLSII